MDVTSDTIASTINNCVNYTKEEPTIDTASLVSHLKTEFETVFSSTYNNCFVVFFVNEGKGTGAYGRAEDISNNSRYVVVVANGLEDTTSAHELLHTAGLYHSFDNNSVFTRKECLTDNIMDYSDIAVPPLTPLNLVSIWKEQEKIIKKHNLIKPEV